MSEEARDRAKVRGSISGLTLNCTVEEETKWEWREDRDGNLVEGKR